MKKLGAYLIIFSLLNLNILQAKTPIKEKLLVGNLKNCLNFSGQIYFQNYEQFYNCLNYEILEVPSKYSSNKKTYQDMVELISIFNFHYLSMNEKYINNEEALVISNELINFDYVKKFKKQKIDKILKNISCGSGKNFENFIKCFYQEFRSLQVYQSSTILTKKDMEKIMYNSLQLIDGVPVATENRVTYEDKSISFGKRSNMFIKKGGYDYFYNAMDKIGEEYYTKFKLSDEQVNKILMFIAISIITAMIMEKLISVKSKGSGGGTTQVGYKTSSSGTSVASSQAPAPFFKFHNTPKSYLFKYAPPNSVLRKPWFRYTVLRGGF